MKTPSHTPGPWTISNSPELGTFIEAHPDYNDGWSICELNGKEANARLIAAAPELLEALITTRGNVASLGPAGALGPYTEWLAMLDAAISKATHPNP